MLERIIGQWTWHFSGIRAEYEGVFLLENLKEIVDNRVITSGS